MREEQQIPPAQAELLARSNISNLADVAEMATLLGGHCRAVVQGRDDTIELVLIALLADGHVLLEDYPGSGKTTLAKSLGESILDESHDDELSTFRRVQFTPDLLPSDITGVMIFDTETNSFHFRRGPVFTHVLLADEINRTSPKVQAALLEAMGEKQVTVDNETYPLNDLFFVIATQNPLDLVGTYPLPLAQLDRFLFKIRMTHLERADELEVLSRWSRYNTPSALPRVRRDDLLAARVLIHHQVAVAPQIHEALVDLAGVIRKDQRVLQGVSTRALVLSIAAMQARAVLKGRDYVSSDDLKALLVPLLAHRVDVVPGVEDPAHVVVECAQKAVETLTRSTLRR
jgi:MoxR-like ATPase